jgi:2-oxoisovalerate dehydrogenase E1 component beta subunit
MATLVQAIRMALHMGETHLGVTDIFGEDVGPPLGGAFTATQGLKTSWNSPLDERGIIGTAMGLAMAGQKPVCEIQFCDYIYNTIDLLKLAGAMHWSSNGDWNCPLVCMTPAGAGIRGSIYHSHSFEATATHLPGWKIVFPSTPRDAYGLMLSAIADPNPVLYLAPKALLRTKGGERIPGEPDDDRALSKMIDRPVQDAEGWQPEWPKLELAFTPLGKARLVTEGSELTVVTYGRNVQMAVQAAQDIGASVDILDLRTLAPYDWDAIRTSIKKTNRVLFLNEELEITNFGEHLIRRTCDELFYELHAPPRLLAGAFVPGIGLADNLEHASVPQRGTIAAAMKDLLTHVP